MNFKYKFLQVKVYFKNFKFTQKLGCYTNSESGLLWN